MSYLRRAIAHLHHRAFDGVGEPPPAPVGESGLRRFLSSEQGYNSVRAVRQAAVLFFAAGVIGLVSDLLIGGIKNRTDLSLLLDTANLLIGCSCWLFLRDRLSGYRSLALVGVALADVALNNLLGEITGGTLGIWFVVVFVWIGAWFPPRTSLVVAPLAVLAYVLPYRFGDPPAGGSASSVLFVIPTAVLVGITISINAVSARRAEHAQQFALAALAKASLTDDLTSLGNRRFGNQLVDSLNPGDVVAVLDLDRFKEVNDHFGHAAGDRVLQELGEFLATLFGDSGQIARMGGEEFLIVYPGMTVEEGARRTEHVLTGWRSLQPLCTLSAGVAIHREGQLPSTTYRLADEALYLAKSRGRDQVATERRNEVRTPTLAELP
jgi:diguanylate cyclase (GGDEF)-like protein